MDKINIFHRKNTDINIDGSEGIANFFTEIHFINNEKLVEEKSILSEYTNTFEDHIKNNDIENPDELFKMLYDYGEDKVILKISEVGHYWAYGKKIIVTNKQILNYLSFYTRVNNEITISLLKLVVDDIYSSIVNISSDNALIKEIITSVIIAAIESDEVTAAVMGDAISDAIEKYRVK